MRFWLRSRRKLRQPTATTLCIVALGPSWLISKRDLIYSQQRVGYVTTLGAKAQCWSNKYTRSPIAGQLLCADPFLCGQNKQCYATRKIVSHLV